MTKEEDDEEREKADIERLIEHARAMGLDPAKVLQWHLMFAVPDRIRKPRRKKKLPAGTLNVVGICRKYGCYPYDVKRLRDQGLPIRTHGRMLLIREADFVAWRDRGQ